MCVIDLFSRYAWVVPLEDKRGATITNGYQSIFKKSDRKPKKIWVDNSSEFYDNVFKRFLKENSIEMYSTHNKGKSGVAERFIKTLKNKIYKHMITTGKNVYFNVLDDIVDKYNNTYHISIKVKPKDVTDSVFIEYNEELNKEDPKFKIGDHVIISKYKNIFAKGYTSNWSKEVFIVKKVKNTVPWTYVINDLNGEEILGSFMKKSCKRLIRKSLELKK